MRAPCVAGAVDMDHPRNAHSIVIQIGRSPMAGQVSECAKYIS
jgi:hypothetical protein